jgi:hypothetical protein
MNLVDPRATAGMFTAHPVAIPVFAASLGVLALIVRSAVRTLRVARAT